MQTLLQLQSGQLKGTIRLKLACGLTEFPNEILDLADTLEILDLTGNRLSELPKEFSELKKLKIAFFSENNFIEWPKVLGECNQLSMVSFKSNRIAFIPENSFPPLLRWLILTNNRITSLPLSIGKCVYLQKVMFAGNLLTELPIEMAACRKIELLRISANKFQQIPKWLFDLPALSWLAFAGNPCSSKGPEKELLEIPWQNLKLGEILGEGASGIISRAQWMFSDKESKTIAVKVFKGDVTSDGLPQDEMNTCIAAGHHPNLVKVIGKIVDHPQQKQGLLFELIPPSFKNLAGPPSFDSCTRDVLSDDNKFSLEQIVKIAKGVASAAAQLHENGIHHGDLYAHNTLIDENAHTLFGDFGAAAFYDRGSSLAPLIERLEIRAWGCFLEDLLLCSKSNDGKLVKLQELKESSMQYDIIKRPDFRTIIAQLDTL